LKPKAAVRSIAGAFWASLSGKAAKPDAARIYYRVVERARFRGPKWFDQLIVCLYSLEHMPRRCPLAREAEEQSEKFAASFLASGAEPGEFSRKWMSNAGWIGYAKSGVDALQDLRPGELAKHRRTIGLALEGRSVADLVSTTFPGFVSGIVSRRTQ
jgi:hypothetical protein